MFAQHSVKSKRTGMPLMAFIRGTDIEIVPVLLAIQTPLCKGGGF